MKKYTTNRLVGLFFTGIATLGILAAISSRPLADMDLVILLASSCVIFSCLSMVFGISVSVSPDAIIRTDAFLFKKKLRLEDIEMIRYQPTYGVGKEASSLYIFSKEESVALITMTNIWFSERTLSDLVKNLRAANPTIRLDEEARELMERF